MMSPAQGKVFDYIVGFMARHEYPPTVRQIMEALGYASPSTVQDHIVALREQGYLEGMGRSLRPARSTSQT